MCDFRKMKHNRKNIMLYKWQKTFDCNTFEQKLNKNATKDLVLEGLEKISTTLCINCLQECFPAVWERKGPSSSLKYGFLKILKDSVWLFRGSNGRHRVFHSQFFNKYLNVMRNLFLWTFLFHWYRNCLRRTSFTDWVTSMSEIAYKWSSISKIQINIIEIEQCFRYILYLFHDVSQYSALDMF